MMVKLAMSQMQTLAVVFMASLWSSAVHCHVLGQVNNGRDSDSETADEDTNAVVLCPEDHFFSTTQGNCARCSQCPMNQVILSPCQGFHNTRCGPFILFQNFGGSSITNGQGEEEIGEIGSKNDGGEDAGKNKNGNDKHPRNKTTVVASEDKAFTWTLIIILAIVLAILVLVVCITCYVRHKSSRPAKELQCEYKPAPVPVDV